MLIFKLNHLPDLDIQTYTTRYGAEVRAKVLERQNDFLTLIHELGLYGKAGQGNGSVVSLRYVYQPENKHKVPLSIYLLVNNRTSMSDQKLIDTLLKSPLVEFYNDWSIVSELQAQQQILNMDNYSHCVEIIKEEASPDAMFKSQERLMKMQAQNGEGNQTLEQIDSRFQELSRNNSFYYVPLYVPYRFEPVTDNNMLFLDRYFQAFNVPLMFEVTLRATQSTAKEIRAVERMLNHLEPVKNFSLKSTEEKNQFSLRGDHQDFTAEAIIDIYEDYHESFLQHRQFEFALKVWGDDSELTQVLADQLAVGCNASGKYRKLELKESDTDFQTSKAASQSVELAEDILWQDYWDDSWENEFQTNQYYEFNASIATHKRKKELFPVLWDLKRFSRLTEIDNIAAFFRLPVPGAEPLLTINKETEKREAKNEADKISLGQDVFKSSLNHPLELEQLKKHMFVSGVPGSGKTTAIFNILVQLFEQGLPFLVFEPAKTEYRLLKRLKNHSFDPLCTKSSDSEESALQEKTLGESLQVYTLGQEHLSPFRFNPFEFPQGITLDEHLSSLEACFRGALPISDGPLPALINEAIDNIYQNLGWSGTTLNQGQLAFPNMLDLYHEIKEVFATKGYSGEVKGNLETAIEVRIGSLLRRSIGKILSAEVSHPNIETLMASPCIIELDALNEVQSNLMIMFLLAQIREYVRAQRRSGSPLSHVIVLEEAHNIIGRSEEGGEDGANPKVEATKYITRFLAEVRALGEGIIIADQLPSAVAPQVIKNTNVKMAHRMVSGDDREELGLTMLLDANQYEEMARLPPGQAFLYQEGMYKPVKIQGDYIAASERCPVLAKSPPDSHELIQLIETEDWSIQTRVSQLSGLAKSVVTEMQSDFNHIRDEVALRNGSLSLKVGLEELSQTLKAVQRLSIKLEDSLEKHMNHWELEKNNLSVNDQVRQKFLETKAAQSLTDIIIEYKTVNQFIDNSLNTLRALAHKLVE